MIRKQLWISISLIASAVFLILLSLGSQFLSFNNFKLSLSGISNTITYEDVRGEVYTSYYDFQSFACRKSRNESILILCSSLNNFALSGFLLKLASWLTIILTGVLLYSKFSKLNNSLILNAVPLTVYLIGSISFLSISNVSFSEDSKNSSLSYSSGFYLLVLSNVFLIIYLFHFYFLLQKEEESSYFQDEINSMPLSKENMNQPSLTENLKEELAQERERFVHLTKNNEDLNFKVQEFYRQNQQNLEKIADLEIKANELTEIKSKYSKALEDLHDLSTVISSFKKDADSKIIDDKTLSEKLMRKKEKIRGLKKNNRSANRKVEKLTNEVEDKTNGMDTLNKIIGSLRSTESESLKKLQEAEGEWEKIKQEFVYNNSLQAKEIEGLQSRLKTQENFFENELKKTQDSQASLKDELFRAQAQIDLYKTEYETLQKALSNGIPEDFDSLHALLQDINSKSQGNISVYEVKISEIIKTKEKLRVKLQKAEEELQTIIEENQQLHKLNFEHKRSKESLNSVDSMSQSLQGSLIIEGISPSIIFHNPLIDHISKLRKEPPMIYTTVWKTLELMMQEKLKVDKNDILMGRTPRSVPDYLFEFMQKQYGLKVLSQKQLKALVVSLEELYKLEHPYAIFFCKVLGIFHPKPIPVGISTYLFRIQECFNGLIKKSKNKLESFPEVYEIMQFGGEASVVDVAELIKKIFRKNREIGERILENLHYNQPDKLEITILRMCAGLQVQGKTEKNIFDFVSVPQISCHELTEILRYKLDIWLNPYEIELVYNFIDDKRIGFISLENFAEKISFEEFCNNFNSKPAMVSKSEFLTSIVQEYEYQVLEDYQKLRTFIDKKYVDPESASRYLLQIDSSLSLDFQERLFKEAMMRDGKNKTEISSESFCIVILKHNIGSYGKGLFQLEYLEQSLSN